MSRPFATAPRLLAALSLAAATTPAATAQFDEAVPVFGTRHAPEELWEVDLQTGQATLATTLSATMVAAAMHPHTGEIFMVDNGGINPIYKWDQHTDVETKVSDGWNVQYHRFGFDACGQLWGVALNTKTLALVDTTTGQPTLVGSIDGVGTAGATGDLAFSPGDKFGFYYGIGFSLYYVPLDTLVAEFLMTTTFEINGLAFQPDGTLYATNKFSLYSLDLDALSESFVGDHGMNKLNDLSSGHWPLVMWPDRREYDTGEDLTLTVTKAPATTRIGLALTSVDGSPFFRFLKLARFDASGTWTQTATIPPPFAGLSLGLRAFGDHLITGQLVATPEIVVNFN